MIYVAYPIDQAGGDFSAELVSFEFGLTSAGLSGFFPGRPWGGAAPDSAAVDAVNRLALDLADAVVAFLPDGVATLGVPVEIERALADNKPVVIVRPPEARRSVQVDSWVSAGARVVSGQREAIEAVRRASSRPPSDVVLVKVDPGGFMPRRAYEGDAGFDLQVQADWSGKIGPGEFLDVPVGVYAEFPPGVWGWIVGRSSTLRNRSLLVNQGIVDQGYRGELFVGVHNVGDVPVDIEGGERLAQLIPMPLLSRRLRLQPTDVLSSSDRGDRGFGSTGA